MQKQLNVLCKHFNDNLLNAFKNASQALKQSAGKIVYETHNKLMNKILLVSEKDLQIVIRQVLTHFLTLAQVKSCALILITLLTKFIDFFKYYSKINSLSQQKASVSFGKSESLANSSLKQQLKASSALKKSSVNEMTESTESKNLEQLISEILQSVIDVILLIQNKSKPSDQEIYLRIIQTTFSLIDTQFIQYMNFSLLTKIYSISFQCCQGNTIIQNISMSCLFSLTETLFSNDSKVKQSHLILQNWLEFLFRNKKFLWIKESSLNGLVWDLVVSAIKNQKQQSLDRFCSKQKNVQLLNLMYKISAEKTFHIKGVQDKAVNSKDNKKSNVSEISMAFSHEPISQFIRCYRAFIVLSVQYSLVCLQAQKDEVVPFRDNLKMLQIIYDLQRNWRMYILLEGIFSLIDKYPEFSIRQQKGYVLLQIVSKVAEELCLGNQKISCQWMNEKSFLNKFYASDVFTINDGDFVKMIRNFLVGLRKKFQYMKKKEEDFINHELDKSENLNSERSDHSKSQNISTDRKRWEKFIKSIIKIIRYLSSISILTEFDEQPARKIILELQHWFLICPSTKIRNLILQELLITTSTLTTKQQAVKISQCIQIGSNLIYGYYDLLDSIGLTIIIKMMAGIKASKEEGKEFEQLEEVFNMSEKLYLQQKIVKNKKNFQTTIQAFVQCANSLVADLEQPGISSRFPTVGKNPQQRYYIMIEYLLQKVNIVILQNKDYVLEQWNFLTGFWMSFCSNKNLEVQSRTILSVAEVIQKLLESFKDNQHDIISIYLELSTKYAENKSIQIQFHIISHIKNCIPLIQNQHALLETFKIIKILQKKAKSFQLNQKNRQVSQVNEEKKFILELSELQEAFIKEGVYKIKKLINLTLIIEGLQVLGYEKNEEYKILTLLWTVADHLRTLGQFCQSSDETVKTEYQNLWKRVFEKIQAISTKSIYAETKQSSIHTFTQIIAESSPLIKDSILIELYEKIFIESLFSQLMQCQTRFKEAMENIETSLKAEMVKVATKNYLKLTKKFILQNIFPSPEKSIQTTLEKVEGYLQCLNSEDQKIALPVDIMDEYVLFVDKLIDSSSVEVKYINRKMVQKIIKELQKMGQGCDQSTLLWRKKYHPHFMQVQEKIKLAF